MSASASLTEYHCDKSSFRIIKPLGSGSTCEVFLAQLVDCKKPHKCEVCALKIVNLKDKVASKQTQLRAEVLALRNIGKHPNIIGLQNYGYDPASATSFVQLSYVGGGDLLTHIEKRPFTEAEAIPMFRDILSAVAFAHSKGFCHRDLKLENILLTDTGSAVVADWGLSTQFTPTTHLQKDCGSLHYAAPEILSASPYLGHLVDSFSLGILFFAMVTGCFPFFGASPRERYLDIATRKRLPFPSHVSVGVRDLISKLLAFTPANRISPAQAVHHFVLEPPAKPKSSAAARIFDVIVPPVSVSVPAGAESSKKSPKTIVSKFFRTSPPKKRSSSKDRNSSSLEDCHVSDDPVTA